MKIWLTSDLHLFHNREFIYKARGFDSVYEMNEVIVKNWNAVVAPDDIVYVLGDLMLNNDEGASKLFGTLKGEIHIICGNHDIDDRRKNYIDFWNVVEVTDAAHINYKGYHFFMTHYPCITASLEKEKLKQCTINLYGHTHQTNNFYQDMPFMYHVGVDSHNCTPVLLDDIIKECELKVQECKNLL